MRVETNIDWSMVANNEDYSGNVFNVEISQVFIPAYSRTERITRGQLGGTYIAIFENFNSKLQKSGKAQRDLELVESR